MAAIWNLCAAAWADFEQPGDFALRRQEVERGQRAVVRAATLALRDAWQGDACPTLITISHSGSVREVICAVAAERRLRVVCGESLPGGEGRTLVAMLRDRAVEAELVADAALTTHFSVESAVVVGADAVAAGAWINKCGTFGLAAAAWFAGVPVYVVCTRDKSMADARMSDLALPRIFERVPSHLSTLFLTDRGASRPEGVPALAEAWAPAVSRLLEVL
jgi:translation initiation factor 2B subunit (eIF-2B alpha/beta/delta family)